MQYRCTSCDETFDVPEGDRARCPKCLRIHDVVPVGEPSSAVSRYRGPIILFTFVALGVGAYVAWYLSQGGDDEGDDDRPAPVAVGPLTPQKLREALEARQVKRGEVVEPFAASKEVEAFAREAAHGRASDQEKAEAVMDAIRHLLDADHEVYSSISPRGSKILDPGETLAALRGEEPFSPYSFELGALMVTACRALDIPAALAEVYQFESARRPADSSGAQGYFVAALPRDEGTSYRRPLLFDPVSGRSGDSAAGEADVLTDVEAVAALFSLKALYLASQAGDTTRAERLATLSVRLRPSSATGYAARGTVRLLSGGGELSARAALEDYERALRERADAQRKILVARILLAMGQVARAEELVRSALDDAPDFGAARGLNGLILAARESFDEAHAELTRAEELEPRDPHISLLWVQYYIGQRDLDAAAAAARAVVDRVPDDPQPRLMLAQVLQENAEYDAVEEQCRELLRRHPDNEQLREVIEQAFELDADELLAGPSVAADEDAGVAAASVDGGLGAGDAGLGGSMRLQMGQGLGKIRLGGAGGFQLSPGI